MPCCATICTCNFLRFSYGPTPAVPQYSLQITTVWSMQLRATQSKPWAVSTQVTQRSEQINKQMLQLNEHMSKHTHILKRAIAIVWSFSMMQQTIWVIYSSNFNSLELTFGLSLEKNCAQGVSLANQMACEMGRVGYKSLAHVCMFCFRYFCPRPFLLRLCTELQHSDVILDFNDGHFSQTMGW